MIMRAIHTTLVKILNFVDLEIFFDTFEMRAVQTKYEGNSHHRIAKISRIRGLIKILNVTGKIETRSNRDLQSMKHLLTKKQPKQMRIMMLKHQLKESIEELEHFQH